MACTYFSEQRFTKESSICSVGQSPMSMRDKSSSGLSDALAAAADFSVSPGSRQCRTRFFATSTARPLMKSAMLPCMCDSSSSAAPCVRFTQAQKRSAHGSANWRSSHGSNGVLRYASFPASSGVRRMGSAPVPSMKRVSMAGRGSSFNSLEEASPLGRFARGARPSSSGAGLSRGGRRTNSTCFNTYSKSRGFEAVPSIRAGFNPSSPNTNCTTSPLEVRTVRSYLSERSSKAFIRRRAMYPVSAVFTAVSTRPSRPPMV
mmetsp:Transcript_42303/g.76490  ORF Transcript_42303/g.76490 Transcript_42303/m.76490 type:complete len:261 (+) Transcript_42303:800-1582(+)